MTTKEYLRRDKDLRAAIKCKQELLKDLEQTTGLLKGIDYSREKVQGGSVDIEAKLVASIDKLEEAKKELRGMILVYTDLHLTLLEQIEAMPTELYRSILNYHYIIGLTLEEVQDRINYSRRQTFRLYDAALEEFAETNSTALSLNGTYC